MTSIGVALRSERLRRGLRLEQVAAETKIRTHLLEAMEDDHFDRLPRGLLTRTFLRQYAHTLGLDEDEILATFKQQFDQPTEPLPEPAREDRSWHFRHPPELVWVLATIFACAGAYELWQDKKAKPPEIVSATVATDPLPKLEASASTGSNLPKRTLRSAFGEDNRTIIAQPMKLKASEPGRVLDTGTQAMRVALTATEPVWLSIKADGTQTYSGTLEGQQRKEFDASTKMTVLIGNAGGLEVSLNGKPVGPLGGRGQVQMLLLTPNGAYVVPRTSNTSTEW
jgi:cytoskeletal protein RodZ